MKIRNFGEFLKNYLFTSHFNSLKKLSIMKKVTIGSFFSIVLFSFSFFVVFIPFLKNEKIKDRKGKLKSSVDLIISIISIYEADLRANAHLQDPSKPKNIEEAKKQVIQEIAKLRYDKMEYFFIIDTSGNLVMHPTKQEKENHIITILNDFERKKLLIESQRDSETFIEYLGETKYSLTTFEKQLLYSRYYWQWGWIICTQVEIKDIDETIQTVRNQFTYIVLMISFCSFIVILLVNYFIIKIPLYNLLLGIQEVTKGNLDYTVKTIFDDELGTISSSFNLMVSQNQKAKMEILQHKNQYKTLIDNLNVGVYRNTAGKKGGFLQANPAIVKIFGYDSVEDFLKIHVSELYQNPEERKKFIEILTANGSCKNIELKLKKKDGTPFWANCSATVMYDENGNIQWIDGVIEDISGRKEVESEREKFTKEVTYLNATLEQKVLERTLDLKASKEELEALSKFTNLINSHSDLNLIFIEISKYVYEKFHISGCWLFLPDEKQEYLKTFKIYSYNKLPEKQYKYLVDLSIPLNKDGGLSYLVWKKKKPFYISKIHRTSFSIDKDIVKNTGAISFLYVPLLIMDEPVGLMGFSNMSLPMVLSKPDIHTINSFCAHISGVIHNADLLKKMEIAKKETEKAKERIEFLNEFSKIINSSNNLDIVFSYAVESLYQRLNTDIFCLFLLDRSKNEFANRCISANLNETLLKKYYNLRIELSADSGNFYSVYTSQKTLYIENIEELLQGNLTELDRMFQNDLHTNSIFLVPLVVFDEVIGLMYINKKRGMPYLPQEEIMFIESLCEQIAIAVNNSYLYEKTEHERAKSEKLLLNILPKEVAQELKEKGFAEPVLFDSVSVLFTDFKGFTKIAETLSPQELVKDLDTCFIQFDKVVERYGLEKLKTIGDSYMCAGGIPKMNKSHSVDCVLAALEIQSLMNLVKSIKLEIGVPYWELRLGIHSGPLVAGVIGEKKFAYDVWGDTVNTASRMESSGTPGKINISGATYSLVKGFFDCEYRGKIDAKNKGEIDMYYVNGLKKEYSLGEDGNVPNEKFWEDYKSRYHL